MKIQCKRCKNIWNYKGANPFCACCSYCKSTVFIKKSSSEQLAPVTKDENKEGHIPSTVSLEP